MPRQSLPSGLFAHNVCCDLSVGSKLEAWASEATLHCGGHSGSEALRCSFTAPARDAPYAYQTSPGR
jgi:hypothetical protein